MLLRIIISEKNKYEENRASQDNSTAVSVDSNNETTNDADGQDINIKKEIKPEFSDELKE